MNVDTWRAAAMLWPGRRQEVLGASAGPGNCGPTYSAIVGATIVFDFSKIIIRGAPILGWIGTMQHFASGVLQSPQRFATNITRREKSSV